MHEPAALDALPGYRSDAQRLVVAEARAWADGMDPSPRWVHHCIDCGESAVIEADLAWLWCDLHPDHDCTITLVQTFRLGTAKWKRHTYTFRHGQPPYVTTESRR